MIVSKAMREFISAEVFSRLEKKLNLFQLEKNYKDQEEAINAELAELEEVIEGKLKELNERYGLKRNRKIRIERLTYRNRGLYTLPSRSEYEASLRNMTTLRENAVNKVVAILEFGGTKKDMDAFLSQL